MTQIFFVSLRTSQIMGPAIATELTDEGSGQALLFFEGENLSFREWEGYAIVCPDQKKVWGAGHPQKQKSGHFTCRFTYHPQDIPPEDLKLFSPA